MKCVKAAPTHVDEAFFKTLFVIYTRLGKQMGAWSCSKLFFKIQLSRELIICCTTEKSIQAIVRVTAVTKVHIFFSKRISERGLVFIYLDSNPNGTDSFGRQQRALVYMHVLPQLKRKHLLVQKVHIFT